MPMTQEHRAKMLASTKERAAALLEDIHYLHDISVRPNLIAAELRRASSVLRRLLVDRDITIVAAPRLGRFMFCAPDNQPFYEAGKIAPFTFFGSGGVELFGVKFRTAIVDLNSSPRPWLGRAPSGRTVQLSLDGFLTQRVLCLNGDWVSRRDVIKYIANVASGVHSGTSASSVDETISRIRQCVRYSREAENSLRVTFDMHVLELRADPVFCYSPAVIDPVLLELFSAINYIFMSENTKRLETVISQELGQGT